MSNLGKQRILLGKNLKVSSHGWRLYAKGRHGEVTLKLPIHTQLILNQRYLKLINHHLSPAIYGSLVRKVKAILKGLYLNYVINLKIIGVGYRAVVEENKIIMRLGFSHEISLNIPQTLKVTVLKRSNLKIAGANYEENQQFAYKLRSFRRPEPFKGKGLVFLGEVVRRKEGKKKKL